MSTLRDEAETLRLGLLMGLVRSEEVVAWADRAVAEVPTPPLELIDISLASGRPPDELARLLKLLPGPADLTTAAHRALGLLRARAVGDGLPLGAVTDMLWVYSAQAVIPEAERQAASNFSYEFEDLAYWGTPEGLRDELERFVAEHATDPGEIV